MNSFYSTLVSSAIITGVFFLLQLYFFLDTRNYRRLFKNFFRKTEEYSIFITDDGEDLTQLKQVGACGSDLFKLISEINHYVIKTKGTTDFSVIQNKVERKLSMRYDQSTSRIAFPTYLGLMGTFLGVFIGILTFIAGFDGTGNITDESIKNLLVGVLVSMFTSLCGLFFTTINNGLAGGARKQIEEDKNEFFDFVQTELMPSLDVSMVAAITKLHSTIDRFEPSFDRVINRFQDTFDRCTKAFGEDFENHVVAVSGAVEVMGRNMDKINENINLQQQLLSTLKSDQFVRGMDKYIDAANHFVSITKSLNKFEEARRMMLVAAHESINLQNQYNESLSIPREIVIRINQILDRIKDFEKNINETGRSLVQRDILGNDVLLSIQDQIKGISRKGMIADKYLEMADGKLEDLFTEQVRVLNEMNTRYRQAIQGHIDGFEDMLKKQTIELENRHQDFINAIEEKFNIQDIRTEFTNLQKLDELHKLGRLESIDDNVKELSKDAVKSELVSEELQLLNKEIQKINNELISIKENTKNSHKTGVLGGFFARN